MTSIVLESGKCRVCGCTEMRACAIAAGDGQLTACWWVDQAHTLCSNPPCIAGIPLDKLLTLDDVGMAADA
jgi:hypothetical protein